ncbi:HNH endonuclease [Paenibacillus gansuensis]|uniref:Putative HNH nuclease YajD n=1 Tax=Paenibacillus gansuensis TaxID=306542 RepID=A0ABW5PI44_9BACL
MARHPEIYATAEWKKARRTAIIRAGGLCELHSKKGKVVKGKEVDHIIELTDDNKHDWNIAYNPDNLQYLCSDCHNHKHSRSNGLQDFLLPPEYPPGG